MTWKVQTGEEKKNFPYASIAVGLYLDRARFLGRSDHLASKVARVLPPKGRDKLRMQGENIT